MKGDWVFISDLLRVKLSYTQGFPENLFIFNQFIERIVRVLSSPKTIGCASWLKIYETLKLVFKAIETLHIVTVK